MMFISGLLSKGLQLGPALGFLRLSVHRNMISWALFIYNINWTGENDLEAEMLCEGLGTCPWYLQPGASSSGLPFTLLVSRMGCD